MFIASLCIFQKVPLHAILSIPQMELSKESLDFGTCLVGQQRELQFLIMNRTASHSHWTAKLGMNSLLTGSQNISISLFLTITP